MTKARPPVDTDIPVCASPPAAVVVKQYLRKSCQLILEVLGERAVTAVVVSGSAVLGELTAMERERDEPLILSDVDLSVVTPTEAHRDAARAARRGLLGKMAVLPEARLMCSPPELGIYSLLDLEGQSRKMGVLEMRTSGKILWGDDGVLGKLPGFRAPEIPSGEATALLFNRCFELLEAAARAGSRNPVNVMGLIYACAKSIVDSGTALAAYHGRYAPGYRRRLQRIAPLLEEHRAGGPGSLKTEAFLEVLSFWTEFKIKPDPVALASRFGVSGRGHVRDTAFRDIESLRGICCGAWGEARLTLMGMWTSLEAAEGSGVAGDAAGTCRALIGAERARDRLRGWKKLVLGGEVPPLRALRLARRGSPVHLLRVSAFRVLDGFELGRDSSGGALGGSVLEKDALRFLTTYFPASVRDMRGTAAPEAWRKRVVDVRGRWIKRYWS